MSNGAPITQDALDRLENNLRTEIATSERHVRELLVEADRRYEQRFRDSQVAVDAALNAAKEAVHKAEAASEKRFEGVNEFRETLGDQQRTLMPRSEAELRMGTVETRLAALEAANAAGRGQRVGAAQTWGYIVGAVGVILALLSYFLKVLP